MEKESFKASVGLAVSMVSSLPKFGYRLTDKPIGVGGSIKASHETQDSKEQSQRSTDTQAMVFEATGGNTILAAE